METDTVVVQHDGCFEHLNNKVLSTIQLIVPLTKQVHVCEDTVFVRDDKLPTDLPVVQLFVQAKDKIGQRLVLGMSLIIVVFYYDNELLDKVGGFEVFFGYLPLSGLFRFSLNWIWFSNVRFWLGCLQDCDQSRSARVI